MIEKNGLRGLDRAVLLTIIVAALGYFVDIFDLLLFSIVRVDSLKDLGFEGEALLSHGITLINAQMGGMLLGGLVWGVIGDRIGRVSVLFGSILLYSLANIANGFVETVEVYTALRFIAGIGLAGELGAGVTLASELLPRRWRGLGTTFIATLGVLGAVVAAVIAHYADWRVAYMIGGAMGLLLLVLRISVRESGMYQAMDKSVSRGNIMLLLGKGSRLRRYLAVIFIGAPTWAIVGLFITFTPEFARDLGMTVMPRAGMAVLACYIGLAVGDLASGLLSQALHSRRLAVLAFLLLQAVGVGLYVLMPYDSLVAYYGICFLLGIGIGHWAMFIQMGAEQFGTNIRALAATSIPNMVRGLTIPITMGFHALIPHAGVTGAGIAIVGTAIILAFCGVLSLRETFDTDLDYVEV